MSKGLWVSAAVLLALTIWFQLIVNQPLAQLEGGLRIIDSLPSVEKQLDKYKGDLGEDYAGYRGHIYRVLTYAIHFLDGDTSHLDLIGLALVYHDLAVWSDKNLAYIEPSVARARQDLKDSLTEKELALVADIIYWHHSLKSYEGEQSSVINAVIKADLIDFSRGLITLGMPRRHIAKLSQLVPNNGFHKALMEVGFRYHGWNVFRIVGDLSSIFKSQ